ncbi:MAG: FAD-binding oxidoreductase [bacterium]|nr:FAD-binding oxidoreductase [bacterium]
MQTSDETLQGWGGTRAAGIEIRSDDLPSITRGAVLTRGLGRSYGDSALPPPGTHQIPGCALADRILSFDSSTGVLRAEAGLSIEEIQRVFLPRNWSFPVLPGTQFVTLGGAVGADIHGKNHHIDGTIGNHINEMLLRLADDSLIRCSRKENDDLFRATLGGMGLTGHILEVEVTLKRIPSPWIWAESERVTGIDAFIEALADAARSWPYTAGWMDALVRGDNLGRGILIRGRWAGASEAPARPPRPKRRLSVPFTFPGWVLNSLSVRAFNNFYFHKHPRRAKRGIAHPESFFHPLDVVRRWNLIYGRRGFTQHQCVLPEKERPGATKRYLEALTAGGLGSFLCVIKDCGSEGEGLLSFPRPGISIAVDLPMRARTQEIVNELNERVLEAGGRIYLAKDALSSAEHFQAMESRLEEFQAVRRRWDPEGRLRSAQSVRLLGDPA